MMNHLNMGTNSKKLALFLITTKGRQIAFRVMKDLAKLRDFDLFVISHNADDIKSFIDSINDKMGKAINYIEAPSNSVCQKRNLALRIAVANGYDYCILSDDDIIVDNVSDIVRLVKLIEALPKDYSVLSPVLELGGSFIYGGLLCRNGTFMSLKIEPKRQIWCSLYPSAAFITIRVGTVARMFRIGMAPFEELFVIQSEDVDFAVKIWLLGYKLACTKLIKVHHGDVLHHHEPWRIYFMYRNRLLLLLLNFSLRSVLYALPFRLLNDAFHSVILLRARSFSILIKAYLWSLLNLKTILTLRKKRREYFKGDEKRLFSQRPLPLY